MQKLLTCVVVFILAVLFSCGREQLENGLVNTNQNNNLIQEAKQYFGEKLSIQTAEGAQQTNQVDWRQRKQPVWDKATTFMVDGKEVVEAPLLVDGQAPLYTLKNLAFGKKGDIDQKNGVTKALFFKHKDGTLKEYVLKLILDEDYSLINKGNYESLSISNLQDGYSGFVILSDWNDNSLEEYRMEKGKVTATTKSVLSNSPNARTVCQPICQNVCVGVSMPCCIMSSNQYDYCCTNTYMSCYPQCYYLCVPDQPIVEPIGPIPGGSKSTPTFSSSDYIGYLINYSNFLSSSDLVLDDPMRPHISATVTNRCQGEALRQLVNNAQNAAVEYDNAMDACLREAGFETTALDMMNRGGFFKIITDRMRLKGGAKGMAGYRTVMYELGFGSLLAAWCVNGAYKTLQTKYIQYESDFKAQYNQPCN